MMFTPFALEGIEWQQLVVITTGSTSQPGRYRVEISWQLDKYRIDVIHVLSGHTIHRVHAFWIRTAVETANRNLRRYTKLEASRAS